MTVRVYSMATLLVASEVRTATSDGEQRALWACSALAGATQQAHRVAILYAAPIPFRHCFLQRVSPPLADFSPLLRNFPGMPLTTTCRSAVGFFDWRAQTPDMDALALLQHWQALPASERAALVHRRVAAAEARVRQRLRDAPRATCTAAHRFVVHRSSGSRVEITQALSAAFHRAPRRLACSRSSKLTRNTCSGGGTRRSRCQGVSVSVAVYSTNHCLLAASHEQLCSLAAAMPCGVESG
jgi:hypothetical protein